MNAKNTKTGKVSIASRQGATYWVSARKIYSQRASMKRLSPEELHARLIVFIGITLSIVFGGAVFGMLYALIFVTQPVSVQAPNDKAFIDLLTTLTVFLTGSLGGVLASNGLKSKAKSPEDTPKDTRNP